MNPYQPPSDDESQLDRIERKHRIEGWCLLAIVISVTLAAVLILLEVLRVNGWKF
jgi:hypothetical protein